MLDLPAGSVVQYKPPLSTFSCLLIQCVALLVLLHYFIESHCGEFGCALLIVLIREGPQCGSSIS